jgi:hypothetical protein
MSKFTKFRYKCGVVLVSVGCLGILLQKIPFVCGMMLCNFAMFASLSGYEMTRSRSWREFRAVGISVLVCLALLILLGRHVLAPGSAADEKAQRFMSQPAVVLLFWLIVLCGIYRNWRKDTDAANATAATQPAV